MNRSDFKYFLAVICFAVVNCQNECPQGWKKFSNKKCYYLEKTFYSYEKARELCRSHEGLLATIKDKDQQRFLNDYIHNSSANDVDVWIGATRVSRNKFQWDDRTSLDYQNWGSGSPSTLDGRDCVVIQASLEEGGWKDISCNKRNYLICESEPVMGQAEMREIIKDLVKNPVPIGFVYTQLPDQPDPSTLWPTVKWKEISSKYAGKFFRVVGGDAEAFGDTQGADSPRLIRVNRTATVGERFTDRSIEVIPGIYSGNLLTGSYVEEGGHHHQHFSFLVSNPEIRPVNTAMRVWIRES